MQHTQYWPKTAIFVLISLLFGQNAFAQQETVIEEVFHDVATEESVPAQFVIPKHWKTGKPRCGRTDDKLYGYVLNDSILIPFEYQELDIKYSDFMLAKRGGVWGALNKKGEAALPFDFKDLRHSKRGTLLAVKSGTTSFLYGLISPQNEVLVPFEFRNIIPVNDSVLIFIREFKQLVVNVLSQEEVHVRDSFEYEKFAWLGNDDAYFFSAQAKGGKTGLVDLENRVLLPFEYDKIIWAKGNFIDFEAGKSFHGLVNFQNQVRVPAVYRAINPTENPNLFRATDERWKVGMIDSTGRVLIPIRYDHCWVLGAPELVKCKVHQGRYALWNTAGQQLTEEIYEEISANAAAPAVVFAQLPGTKEWRILDRTGKVICRELLDEYYLFHSGFKGEIGGKAAIFDLSGKQLTDFVYTYTRRFDSLEDAQRKAQKAGLPEGVVLICTAQNPAGAFVYIDNTGKEFPVRR